MPLIKTTSKHAMLLQTPPIGRYPAEITNVIVKPNKAGNGHNVVYTFTLRDEVYNGKPIDLYCPMGHDFGVANMLMINKAITGNQDAEQQFDPEKDHKDALVVVELEHELYNNTPQARIGTVLPKETALDTPFD